MHQVGFVERVAIELLVERLAHEDLRSLGDPREEFVGRVGGEDHRLFGLGAIRADRVHVFVEVMECGMGQPGFVEMERADASVEHRAELLDVVEDPVVGALSDGQNSGLAIRVLGLRFLGKRIGVDFALDALERELVLGNRTDDPQVVSRWGQEDRHGSGHDDRVENRFVAIAIDHDDVPVGDRRVPDDFVRCRGPVGYKEAVIAAEDPSRIAFRGCHRAGVVEELAEFFDRVAHVGSEHIFAEELVEHLPDGAFEEGHAPGVPRAVPGVRSVLGVVDHRAEKRRREAFDVRFGFAEDVPSDKLGSVLEHMDKAVKLTQDIVGDVARGTGLAVEENRYVCVFEADLRDELTQIR